MHRLKPAFLLTVILIALGGCGQKGPLYLPDGGTPAIPLEPETNPEDENETSA